MRQCQEIIYLKNILLIIVTDARKCVKEIIFFSSKNYWEGRQSRNEAAWEVTTSGGCFRCGEGIGKNEIFELVIRQFEVSKIQDWCAEKCYFLGFWLSWKKKNQNTLFLMLLIYE